MSFGRVHLADDDDDHVPAATRIIVPPRKQLGAPEAGAVPNLIGIREGLRNAFMVIGEKVRMSLRDVTRAFVG